MQENRREDEGIFILIAPNCSGHLGVCVRGEAPLPSQGRGRGSRCGPRAERRRLPRLRVGRLTWPPSSRPERGGREDLHAVLHPPPQAAVLGDAP